MSTKIYIFTIYKFFLKQANTLILNNNTEPVLLLKNVAIGYNRPVFNNINQSVNKGEIVAITGKNGIGKSTLLKSIAGLQSVISGHIYINNKTISSFNNKEKAKIISFVSGEISRQITITVRELVAMGRHPYTNMFGTLSGNDNKLVDELLQAVDISDISQKNIFEISDGQLQRTIIARALAQDTGIIVLDEPTAFLDLPNRYEILFLLKRLSRAKNKTIIFSSHDISICTQIADKILLMKEKEIVSGAPEDLILNNEFDNLFLNKNLKFVKKTGQYHYINKLSHSIGLKGEGMVFDYTRTALNRAGFNVTCNKDCKLNVIVLWSDKSYEWIIEQNGKKFSFRSIYDLIQYINNI